MSDRSDAECVASPYRAPWQASVIDNEQWPSTEPGDEQSQPERDAA